MMRIATLKVVIAVALFQMANPASAATCTLIANGLWQTAGDWSCAARPVAGDAANIIVGGFVTINQPEAIKTLANAGTVSIDGINNNNTFLTAQSFNNSGTININGNNGANSGALLDLVGAAGSTNTGTILASNIGELKIGNLILTNTGGTITALNGGNVVMQNGASIVGGTLASLGNGLVRAADGSSVSLSDVTLSAGSQYLLGNSATVLVNGAITNNGQFEALSGNSSQIRVNSAAGVTFNGNGAILLQDPNARILDDGGSRSFTNGASHSIDGFGQIGAGSSLVLNNQGVISANGAQTLTLQTSSAVTNSGTLRAVNSSTLSINGTVVDNSNLIAAFDHSTVSLTAGASIVGGTLTTFGGLPNFGGGVIRGADGQNVSLDGVTLTGGSYYRVGNNATTFLSDTVTNFGEIQTTASGGNASVIAIDSAAGLILDGNGRIILQDANAKIVDDGGSRSFINNSSIEGFGQIGAGSTLVLDNRGAITASDATGRSLTLQSTHPITSSGSLFANNGGTLSVQTVASITGGGIVFAQQNSKVIFGSGATPVNLSGGTLSGGIWDADSGGGTALIDFQANNTIITINNAEIGLLGTAGQIQGRDAAGVVETIDQTLTTNNGKLQIENGRVFNSTANGGNFTNTIGSTLTLQGGTFQSSSLVNNGTLTNLGTGVVNVSNQVTGNGLILVLAFLADAPLTISNGVNLGTGSQINILSLGGKTATLNLANAVTASFTDTLTISGGNLALGSQNIVVAHGYDNSNFGAGNSFNRRAGVTGAGQIRASGDVAQTVAGVNVINGTTATPSLTIGNVHVGATTFNYTVNNIGTNGPSLRGALQTSVNGGNITDARLSGSGVTASNYGPVATSANSGNLGVTFTAASAGTLAPLSGQAIHIANNFDNVSQQTLGIVLGAGAAAYNLASSSVIGAINFGVRHVGDGTITQNVSVTNTAVAGAFSEGLDTSFGAFTGSGGSKITTMGSVINLAAGSTNGAGSLQVKLGTSTVGMVNGTLHINQASNGTISGLANTNLSGQDPAVTADVQSNGMVVRFAVPQINNAPLNFGNVRVGSTQSRTLSITNNVPNDGFSESLIGVANGGAGAATSAGAFGAGTASPPSLAPMATDTTHITVGLNTSTAGAKSGNAIIDFKSDGTGFMGGTITDRGNTNVAVQGDVYRLANPTVNTPAMALAGRVGGVGDISKLTGAISIINSSPDIYTETLGVTRGADVAGFTGSGSPIFLAANTSDSSSLRMSLNTSAAGHFSGTQTFAFTSTGKETGAAAMAVSPTGVSTVALSGNVYTPAVAHLTSTTPINFGIVHVGDAAPSRNVTVVNDAAVTTLNDTLLVSFASATGVFTGSGNLGPVGLGAKQSASSSLSVGMNTATAGVYSGHATFQASSHDGQLADLALTDLNVGLVGQVNNFALAALRENSGAGVFSGGGASYVLDLGQLTQNTGHRFADLGVFNNVLGPADVLNGAFTFLDTTQFGETGFGPFMGLMAGQSDDLLNIDFNTAMLGNFSDQIRLTWSGSNAGGFQGPDNFILLTLRANVVQQASVPEPATLGLLGLGLAGIGFARRKRKG